MENDKILMVDDDQNILRAYERQLRSKFDVETSTSGDNGLKVMAEKGPFSVVVADMKMPGMDGIKFLSEVQAKFPNTVRIMLTGNSDQQTAIDAVNEGNIFRFLTKPCPSGIVIRTLDAGIKQYHLIMAEKILLEKTLSGSIKVLIDVLAVVNPAAFSRANRLKKIVRHISREMKLSNTWKYELAALLSQIGCVTLPQDILEKVYANKELTPTEEEMFRSHPSVAGDLLAKIPRLETIAQMIEKQQKSFADLKSNMPHDDVILSGASILRAALDFDQLVFGGMSAEAAVRVMIKRQGKYDCSVVTPLKNINLDEPDTVSKVVKVFQLDINMIIDEEIRSKSGLLLVARGQKVNFAVLKSLRNFYSQGGIPEEIHVLVPKQNSQPEKAMVNNA